MKSLLVFQFLTTRKFLNLELQLVAASNTELIWKGLAINYKCFHVWLWLSDQYAHPRHNESSLFQNDVARCDPVAQTELQPQSVLRWKRSRQSLSQSLMMVLSGGTLHHQNTVCEVFEQVS